VRKFYDKHVDLINIIDANSGTRGMTGKVLVGAFVYLLEGGDIENLRAMRRFMRYGTADGCTNAMLYACSKLMRNENRYTATVEAPVMLYKALMAGEESKIVRVSEQEKTEFSEKCKAILREVQQ
jgi:hypothetical protein